MRRLILLLVLLPFAANAATNTPTREFQTQSAMYRIDDEDLVPMMTTRGDSVFFGAHINTDSWSGTNDPQPLMIVSGLDPDGGTNKYIRFQGDKTESDYAHQLDLRLVENAEPAGNHTLISTVMVTGKWYAIGAQITVEQDDELTVKVYQQEHGTGTPLTTEQNDILFTWANLMVFALGQHCYDRDNDAGTAPQACGHEFKGFMATPIWVHNATEEDILKFMNKVHPDNLWSGTDYIIQPNLDTMAEKTGGIVDWTEEPTLGEVGTMTLNEDVEAQDPTFLGVTLSWLEDLFMKLRTVGVGDAN
jgi:hypothetical protein